MCVCCVFGACLVCNGWPFFRRGGVFSVCFVCEAVGRVSFVFSVWDVGFRVWASGSGARVSLVFNVWALGRGARVSSVFMQLGTFSHTICENL